MPRIFVAYGTRPERIKIGSVVDALRERGAVVDEWFSGQSPGTMGRAGKPWPTMHAGVGQAIAQLDWQEGGSGRPDAVLVQGDTATAFAAASGAFMAGVPVGHIEAGLRTYASEPWPEEGFRRAITAMARWHFCPDELSARNVAQEIGRSNVCYADWGIFVTGNPYVDTLPDEPLRVLATLHRRENWGERIARVLRQLDRAAEEGFVVDVVKHPNWGKALEAWLPGFYRKLPRLRLLDPVEHAPMLARIRAADVIVTDSGGLQEEAAWFGKPCLVVRTATEREALARSGAVRLVNPDDPEAVLRGLREERMRRRPYGGPGAGARIASWLMEELERNPNTGDRDG